MREAVLIKSFPNGITLILNGDCSFEQILEEVAGKFSDGRNFFGKARVALSIEGRTLTAEEESLIVDAIRQNCNVKVICIVGHNLEMDKNYIRALEYVENKLTGMNECQFYKGSLKDNDVIETEQSVVILGDINPGSAVMAGGNIIVLGGLYGEAYAGGNGKEGACVVALEMEPERLKIGDFKYKTADKSKWSIKPKVQPKIAHVKNNKIVFDPLTKELLDSF